MKVTTVSVMLVFMVLLSSCGGTQSDSETKSRESNSYMPGECADGMVRDEAGRCIHPGGDVQDLEPFTNDTETRSLKCEEYRFATCNEIYQPTTCTITRFTGFVNPNKDVVGMSKHSGNSCFAQNELKLKVCELDIDARFLEFTCKNDIEDIQ